VMPASANSLGSRPWWVAKARSERPRASGEYATIMSIHGETVLYKFTMQINEI
jgi:hypothetical protein